MINTVKKTETRGRPTNGSKTNSRPTRIPMSGSRKRMHVDPELFPGFHIAWINDQKDLIPRAKRALYEHVRISELPHWGSDDPDAASSPDSLVSMTVSEGVTAYLMKLPLEFWEEDQRTKREENEARTADLKKDLNSGQNGTYGNVEIS